MALANLENGQTYVHEFALELSNNSKYDLIFLCIMFCQGLYISASKMPDRHFVSRQNGRESIIVYVSTQRWFEQKTFLSDTQLGNDFLPVPAITRVKVSTFAIHSHNAQCFRKVYFANLTAKFDNFFFHFHII